MSIIQIEPTWLQCIVFAMIITLTVYDTYLIVTYKNAQGFTQNKLTMRPYRVILYFSFVFLLQMTCAIVFNLESEGVLSVMLVINVTKFCLQNSAVAVQIFEWFALYRMIDFQRRYDMTTVGVELRKFKPIELRDRLIYKLLIYTIVSISFGIVIGVQI